MVLEPVDYALPNSPSPRKRGKAASSKTSSAAKQDVVQPQTPAITFVDSSESKEQNKKESFENFGEANSVADYLLFFKNELDFENMAIMSPLRTQALLIKNVVQEKRKSELGKKISKFSTIGSFEDFISMRFPTIVVSLVRTSNFDEAGILYNS